MIRAVSVLQRQETGFAEHLLGDESGVESLRHQSG
jgi:hypothetical protein